MHLIICYRNLKKNGDFYAKLFLTKLIFGFGVGNSKKNYRKYMKY